MVLDLVIQALKLLSCLSLLSLGPQRLLMECLPLAGSQGKRRQGHYLEEFFYGQAWMWCAATPRTILWPQLGHRATSNCQGRLGNVLWFPQQAVERHFINTEHLLQSPTVYISSTMYYIIKNMIIKTRSQRLSRGITVTDRLLQHLGIIILFLAAVFFYFRNKIHNILRKFCQKIILGYLSNFISWLRIGTRSALTPKQNDFWKIAINSQRIQIRKTKLHFVSILLKCTL